MTAPAVQKEGNIIEVAGRRFSPVAETTYEQDMFIMKILRDAGLAQMTEGFDPVKDDLSEAAQNLIVRAFASGKLFTLLAATLEEEGHEWTMADAERNGVFFSRLKKLSDKEALRGSIVGILTGFLISGVLSSRISGRSSLDVALTPAQLNDVARSFTSSEAPADATSESGTPSSVNSPDTTPTTTG